MYGPLLELFQLPAFLREFFTSDYAFLVLFVLCIIEGAMLLYFMPSEAIVPGAIVLMDATLSEIVMILGVAVLGATIGQYALFTVAKRGGREQLRNKRWFRISEKRLDRFDQWFDRWGPLAVPVSNSLPFARGMLTVPAGFAGMNNRLFIVLSALGTLIKEAWLAVAILGVLQWLG